MRLSEPHYSGFSPDYIPYQRAVCDLLRDYDYSKSTPVVLLSGSYGSAKSILMAHLTVRHCQENKRARACLGRRSWPDLKKTLWNEILEHMEEDFIEGIHYKVNRADHVIRFNNGSEIITATWADKLYKKFRSLKLSFLAIEEIVENSDDDMEAFKQLKARLRRLPHVKENILMAATNPDAPGHWVYKYFIEPNLGPQPKFPDRFVFYSRTSDNPFIDPVYTEQLKRDMTPKEAERYLEGKWIEISGEVVYYAYSEENKKHSKYEVNPKFPILLSWDFNIGVGKPISMACLQYIDGIFHIFNEVVISGGRTADTIDELEAKGLFNKEWRYRVCGDASGKNRDTRYGRSDYDIIKSELDKRVLNYDFCVFPSNAAVRNRHNKVNSFCLNALGERRLFTYNDAPTADEALRLTKLKPGATYIEDDSKSYQHIGTAIGYAIMWESLIGDRKPQGTILL